MSGHPPYRHSTPRTHTKPSLSFRSNRHSCRPRADVTCHCRMPADWRDIRTDAAIEKPAPATVRAACIRPPCTLMPVQSGRNRIGRRDGFLPYSSGLTIRLLARYSCHRGEREANSGRTHSSRRSACPGAHYLNTVGNGTNPTTSEPHLPPSEPPAHHPFPSSSFDHRDQWPGPDVGGGRAFRRGAAKKSWRRCTTRKPGARPTFRWDNLRALEDDATVEEASDEEQASAPVVGFTLAQAQAEQEEKAPPLSAFRILQQEQRFNPQLPKQHRLVEEQIAGEQANE